MEPMPLNRALYILATMYTREDRYVGFMVEAMASPCSTEFSQEDCIEAWKVVRDHLHMPTEPEARYEPRP